MRKTARYGFQLWGCSRLSEKDMSIYTGVLLTRREWRSFCYQAKIAQAAGFIDYDCIYNHRFDLVNGTIPKENDRVLYYKDAKIVRGICKYLYRRLCERFAAGKWADADLAKLVKYSRIDAIVGK